LKDILSRQVQLLSKELITNPYDKNHLIGMKSLIDQQYKTPTLMTLLQEMITAFDTREEYNVLAKHPMKAA
jgi:hypothetical protein